MVEKRSGFWVWLTRGLAANRQIEVVLDRRKGERRHRVKKSSRDAVPLDDEVLPCNTSLTEKTLERRQMSTCVQDKVLLLPEAQRTVLFLYDVLGFTQKEIAHVLAIRIENVKVRLHRARKRLKSILRQDCTFERDERDVFVCQPKSPGPPD